MEPKIDDQAPSGYSYSNLNVKSDFSFNKPVLSSSVVTLIVLQASLPSEGFGH